VGETQAALTTCTSGPFVEGVDVSDGQGNIDWNAVKGGGVDFGIAKATQGTYNTQGTFAANWANMKAAGVVRGAYHFFDPTEDGAAQASYFLGVVGTIEPGDLPPMLDIECPDGDAQCLGFSGGSGAASASDIYTRMWDWIHTVENATGRKPLIYSFGSYFADNGINTTGLDAYPLNIAYPVSGNCFNFPGPWSAATIWQWSFTGSVSGIGGQVDRDRFLGTSSQLESFCNGSSSLSEVNGNGFLTVANWKDGHTEVFARKTSGQATHSWTQGTTDTWNNADDLKGAASCGLASVVWPPTSHDTVELFDPTAGGSTQHLWFSNGAWNAFQDFGGTGLSQLSTVAWPDGHVEVFALGGDSAIWHNWWTSQNTWSGWQSMQGGLATGVSPIVWSDGHVEIFATDAKGAVWHNWSTSKGWNGWASLGGALASRPVVARWADGHMELFGTGLDGHLTHAWWNGKGWTAFATLNAETTIEGEPSVLVYPAYGPEVFARDDKGQLNHMWVDTSQSSGWSKWAADFNQVIASSPFAWMRADGQAEVFAVDAKGDLLKSLHSASS
jgi:GH25 family lysozyme M1 (1,4-beta-N-acetylmuramidase)